MRRFQNCRRTEARRKAQRDRAQARIARAARERAAYVRLTTAEERSREEPIVFMGDEEKVRDRLAGPRRATINRVWCVLHMIGVALSCRFFFWLTPGGS